MRQAVRTGGIVDAVHPAHDQAPCTLHDSAGSTPPGEEYATYRGQEWELPVIGAEARKLLAGAVVAE